MTVDWKDTLKENAQREEKEEREAAEKRLAEIIHGAYWKTLGKGEYSVQIDGEITKFKVTHEIFDEYYQETQYRVGWDLYTKKYDRFWNINRREEVHS